MEVPVHGVLRQSDGRSKVALIEGTRWVSNDRDMVEGFGRNEEGLRPGAPFQFGRQVQLTSGAFNFLYGGSTSRTSTQSALAGGQWSGFRLGQIPLT